MPNGTWSPRWLAPKFINDVVGARTDDCIVWPFARNGCGYGTIRISGKTLLAHRVVCERVHGEPPDARAVVRHACGNGHQGCVNPHHLVWGTMKENGVDRSKHGRSPAKLTPSQVVAIRNAFAACGNQREVARQFGINYVRVHKIVRGHQWTWLDQP